MEMQDKEFDEVFRSKLEGFEVKPSAGVWTGIVSELVSGKRKKYLFPLSIAASILILVAAGVLFIPNEVKINGKKTVQNRITKTVRPTNSNILAKDDLHLVSSKQVHQTNLNETGVAVNTKVSRNSAKVIGSPQATLLTERKSETEKPDETNDQPVLASVPQKQQEAIKSAAPDEGLQPTINPSVKETPVLPANPSLIASQLPAVGKQHAAPAKPKHKIHSLGDFLNVVVAAVDKRRDKIIEFSDTDDDESTVTGINLGVIKIKKEEK